MALKIVRESTRWDRTPEAAAKLVHRGMARLEQTPEAVILLSSQEYNLPAMLPALRVLLGDVPVWGGTLRQIFGMDGRPARSLEVALLAGEGVKAQARWFADLEQADPQVFFPDETSLAMALLDAQLPRLPRWLHWLAQHQGPLLGALVGNVAYMVPPLLCGGHRGGSGGAALLTLQGVRVHMAWGTGWGPSGLLTEVTESQAEWVSRLEDAPPAQRLAAWLGRSERDWTRPPLRELARLYPLAVDRGEEFAFYAPLAVETDGRLRLSQPLQRGEKVHLMVGSAAECLEAARRAARQALKAFGPHRPQMALLLVDWAWAHLFWAHPHDVYRVVQQALGKEIPILGGYTYGPLARLAKEGEPPRLLDNHLLVALLG